MNHLIPMLGRKFNRWTVLKFGRPVKGLSYRWFCRCECGTEKEVSGSNLRNGYSKSCGCLATELHVKATTKHGKHRTSEYTSWAMMRNRCDNPKRDCYKYYGGIGVTYCERWNSFENFLSDMGPKPTREHSLDRKDPYGNYEPSNCRWATRAEQARNQRRHVCKTT